MDTETVDKVETQESNSEHSLDYEAKARELGWVEKEKFRGDPSKHVDAKTYYEKGELVLPIVKKQRDEAKKEADALRKEVLDMKSTLQDVIKFNEDAAERKYKAEVEQLKAIQAKAVAESDATTYKAASDALDEARENKPKPVEKKAEQQGDPEFESWVAENEWYKTDAKKRRLANAIGVDLASENPNLKGKALFKAVTDEIERIESERSGVERPGPQRAGKTTGNNSKAKTFDNLPAEYKQAFAKFERTGIKMTKEQYVAKCDPDAWGA